MEMMIVVAIIMIIARIAIIQLEPELQQLRANAAIDQVKDAFRLARQTSISQRRTIVIQFVNAAASSSCLPAGAIYQCIELSQMVEPGNVVQAPYLVLPIESTVQFMTFNGLDTPDGYGVPAGGGIMFGGIAGGPVGGMEFQSDGTFVNSTGTPINGTVFMGIANIPTTARAVTILGNTGRVHAFQGSGSAWYYF
jgi:hypothetical protein